MKILKPLIGADMLNLNNVSYSIGEKDILKNININFEEGNIYILTGPNGGGKTSLGKAIVGLYEIDKGTILYKGEDITKKKISDRSNLGISYGFQAPIHFKGLSVKDILKLSSKRDDFEYLSTLLSRVGLCAKEYLDRDLDENLSGGEIKRIEIASVLAKQNTELFIFDEPEAGIDLWSFKELISIFKELKQQKKTLIIISHQEKILELSDFICVINKGEIERFGKSEDILSSVLKKDKEHDCVGCLKKEVL